MPAHPEQCWQIVGTYTPPSGVDAQQEVLRYTRLATKHPGCCTAYAAQDLESGVYRIYQEWNSKEHFLVWLKETHHPGEGFSMTQFETFPFAAPDVSRRPHHLWGNAERKQLTKGANPHLFFLSADNRHKHALFNNTTDLQFDVSMRFPKQSMSPCEGVAVEGEHFKVTVFPGQTKPYVEGKWNGGYAVSYSYGPVTDPAYLESTSKELSDKVRGEIRSFKDFLASHGLNADEPDAFDDEKKRTCFEMKAVELCVQHGNKYIDLVWPPCQTSISNQGQAQVRAWMRPEEYLSGELKGKQDLIITDREGVGIEPGDIDQGALGDCWFMAAIAACAEMPKELVVPMFTDIFETQRNHQNYKEKHKQEVAAGFFKIRLAKHGWWRWHIVDDFLPVMPIKCPGAPCFAKNREQPNELWVAMLEKVYAKCHGSYQAIAGGDPAVALGDLTGFPTVNFEWPQRGTKGHSADGAGLFQKVMQHDSLDRMLWMTTPGEDTTSDTDPTAVSALPPVGEYEKAGLVTGHAYTILKAIEVPNREQGKPSHRLVQIRNPWGGAREWNKDWCDYDASQGKNSKWIQHPEVAQAIAERWHNQYPSGAGLMGNPGPGTVLENKKDGAYWMSWCDCLTWFDGGGVCLRQKGWQDVRFTTGFSDGCPDHFFKITPSSSCQAIAYAIQHDRRGLPRDDPRVDPCALRVEVLKPGTKKPMFDVIAQSHQGVFMYANQVVAFSHHEGQQDHEREEPFELEKGKEYYIIVRQHPNEQKQNVRNRDGIVLVLQTSDGNRQGPRSAPEPVRGIQAFQMTPKVKESCKYVGYYGLTDEDAQEDDDIPCQVTFKGATDMSAVPGKLR